MRLSGFAISDVLSVNVFLMRDMSRSLISYFGKNLSIVIGLVLIWRGIWHVLDWIDISVFEGNKLWTAIGGIVVGLAILYLPDKDLKELEKL
jgi:hypothetical protein